MKSTIHAYVKRLLHGVISFILKMPGGQYIYELILNAAMSLKMDATYRGVRMTFSSPNWLTRYRVSTFSSKEPETLEWIESLPVGSTFWDIGANIGLYAIYAARIRNCRVYAFEPSVFNLELLAKNIFLNSLQERISIVPIALSDQLGASMFKMSTTTWGGALSAFGQDFDQNGATLKKVFEYQTLGVSMDDVVTLLGIPQPRFIKIDVDGIEHFILRGGKAVLARVDSVLIEINDDFKEQTEESSRLLRGAGLDLYRKCNLGSVNQFNQWWIRRHSSNT